MNVLKLLLPFLLLASSTYSQITSALNPGVGESIGYMYVKADTLKPRAPSQPFYQFTVFDSVPTSLDYVAPASTPFDDSINDPSKNLSVQVGSAFSYYHTDANEWAAVGYASENFGVTYSNHLPLFRYPIDSGTSYSDSATAIFNNAGIEVHRTAKISAVADADATVVVVDSTLNFTPISGPCLRLHVTESYNDDTYVNGIFYKTYRTTVESFYWIMKDPNIIGFSLQTISFNDLADPANNTSRTVARYNEQ